MTLPLVTLSDSAKCGREIDSGLSTYGFLQIRDIGIDPADLQMVFDASAGFFHGDAEMKRKCAYRSAAENFGYQGLLEENLDPSAPADLKETFTMRNIVRNALPAERWPSAAFRDAMIGFYAKALASAHRVQRTMARALGMPEDFFVREHSGDNVTLRLLYYPAYGTPSKQPDQLGAGAHTDYGFMTFLFQHGVGGLQVIDANGNWIDVPPRHDAVVVNSGDLLERWTNGRYKSTRHRVMTKTNDQDRYSIAMFVDPDTNTQVAALPSCTGQADLAKQPPISAGAHLQAKLQATHKGRFAL